MEQFKVIYTIIIHLNRNYNIFENYFQKEKWTYWQLPPNFEPTDEII